MKDMIDHGKAIVHQLMKYHMICVMLTTLQFLKRLGISLCINWKDFVLFLSISHLNSMLDKCDNKSVSTPFCKFCLVLEKFGCLPCELRSGQPIPLHVLIFFYLCFVFRTERRQFMQTQRCWLQWKHWIFDNLSQKLWMGNSDFLWQDMHSTFLEKFCCGLKGILFFSMRGEFLNICWNTCFLACNNWNLCRCTHRKHCHNWNILYQHNCAVLGVKFWWIVTWQTAAILTVTHDNCCVEKIICVAIKSWISLGTSLDHYLSKNLFWKKKSLKLLLKCKGCYYCIRERSIVIPKFYFSHFINIKSAKNINGYIVLFFDCNAI